MKQTIKLRSMQDKPKKGTEFIRIWYKVNNDNYLGTFPVKMMSNRKDFLGWLYETDLVFETEKSKAGKTTELIMLLIKQYLMQDVQSYNRTYEAVFSSIKLHDRNLQTEGK